MSIFVEFNPFQATIVMPSITGSSSLNSFGVSEYCLQYIPPSAVNFSRLSENTVTFLLQEYGNSIRLL
jgi:hypothetical protein